jgi:hypothetical protein
MVIKAFWPGCVVRAKPALAHTAKAESKQTEPLNTKLRKGRSILCFPFFAAMVLYLKPQPLGS